MLNQTYLNSHKLLLTPVSCIKMAGNRSYQGNWRYNLYNAMQDPNLIVFKDQVVVIIKDKYPKSELHFLVMPLQKINDLQFLTHLHFQLLVHMERVTQRFIQNFPGYTFWWGFHADPTMAQLHMHVISDDFRGGALKTAKHFNSFTTSFFIPLSKAIADLQIHGRVQLPSPQLCQELLRAPLVCHKCGHRPVNMPSLKTHLLCHIPV